MDPVQQFVKASKWAGQIVHNVKRGELEASTPCDEWDVKELINHITAGVKATGAAARDEDPDPKTFSKDHVGNNPVTAYAAERKQTVAALEETEDVLEQTFRTPFGESPAPAWLSIMGTDQLVHAWDLAKATGQDTTMPADLVEAAWATVDGKITDEQRGDFFKPAVAVPDGAPTQDKLLAYSGRNP